MASNRSRRAPTLASSPRPSARKAKALGPSLPPLQVGDAELAALTRDILALYVAAAKRDVTSRAEQGRLLLVVRRRLKHGEWLDWLTNHVPFTSRTAERAIALHHLSLTDPRRFQRLAPLGVGKANVVITLPHATADHLLAGSHTIPSSGAAKTLLAMSFGELMEVIAALDEAPVDPASALLTAYARQVRAVVRTVRELVKHRDVLDEDDVAELHDDLVEATALLADAFALDEE